MVRFRIAALAAILATPLAYAQAAPEPAKPAAEGASSTAAPEGGEKKRRLKFRDDKAACAPGSLGEADITATLTNKAGATDKTKRSDK